jgi:nucleotide-binding universal stress UspA family protein
MFKNVVVGVDHREGGRDAVALAQQLVSAASTLTVAHVYTGDPSVYRGVSSEYAAHERRRDLERMAQARADAGAEAELRWHQASSVGCGLHELCEALHADLLVVGAPHRHGFGHLLEHDAGRTLRDSVPRAIAIAPVGYRCEPPTVDEVGVGYTGSRASRDALRVARELASEYGSRLSAFEAIDVSAGAVESPAADETLRAARARIAKLTGAEAHAAWGRPSEELTLYSRVVDLLVIGSPRRLTLGRPRRSGVARELARTARCPLLVVRATAVPSRDVANGRSHATRASTGA